MPTTINRPSRLGLAGTILITATISLTGCAAMRTDAESEKPFSPDWGGAFRVPPANSNLAGFSETSRQIERNLGYE